MQIYEVCLASDWEYDRDLFDCMEQALHGRGHSTYLVWPQNLDDTIRDLGEHRLGFRYLVDRASNTSEEFLGIYRLLSRSGVLCLEAPEAMLWASDKATMHLEFLSAGIPVPHTLILEPYALCERVVLEAARLEPLGEPFVIKPANTTGGGIGVFQDARGTRDIQRLRQEHEKDKYLLQEKIQPRVAEGKRFWFRAFYSSGNVHCCWWNETSHVYDILSDQDVAAHGLERLFDITRRIAAVCRLELFSAEIVLDPHDRYVVVDYVNESPDLRRKSQFEDGVPDDIVQRIVARLAERIHGQLGELPAG